MREKLTRIALLAACLVSAGCEPPQTGAAPKKYSSVYDVTFYRDPQSGCQYLVTYGGRGPAGITPRLSKDGLPDCRTALKEASSHAD